MDSYYFVKYNRQTVPDHMVKYVNTGSVICFDFEDCFQDTSQKNDARSAFHKIQHEIFPLMGPFKAGIRVNNNRVELEKDLAVLKSSKLKSILIPKVESAEQVNYVKKRLEAYHVKNEEIIPIIETRTGLKCLGSMIGNMPEEVRKIGFGHCDYNLNINRFPFFHQDTKQYWKWINEFKRLLEGKNLAFINSAYLFLDNMDFFNENLERLSTIFGTDCGQFALTTSQACSVANFTPRTPVTDFEAMLKDVHNLAVPENYAENLISEFENDNKDRSFSISKDRKRLISPQEYESAKRTVSDKLKQELNCTFVGGCFPVQHDILFEELFHQKLKNKLETNHNVRCNVNIIRYERFLTCMDKIEKYNKNNKIDVLIFHIRSEPLLRLVKLYYRYLDPKGKLKHALNIPLFNFLQPEKNDILVLGRRYNYLSDHPKSSFRKALADLNYKMGIMAGNRNLALKKYDQLVKNINDYCGTHRIQLIILGPGYRNEIKSEPGLCEDLNKYMKKKFPGNSIPFINGLSRLADSGESYFNKNGIHAKANYHTLIADALYEELSPKISCP